MWVPTEDGTSGSTKPLTAQAVSVQKVAVGRAGVRPDGTRPIHRAEEEEHRSLVVAFEIRTSCTEATWSEKLY